MDHQEVQDLVVLVVMDPQTEELVVVLEVVEVEVEVPGDQRKDQEVVVRVQVVRMLP